ncbi:MAG: ATP-binding cassette domain-containing protein [Peptococcaceae bacterium]|jgi:D-methionine transport system ATP-binding protein|nr:ATP-binding cassette domain-containing protein [Peptococcaceae bacterium]
MQEGKDLIQIKDLHKVFKIKGRDVIALEGINLTIKEGEIFGIIGLSGAGKSTLVRCINFLEKPTSGAVVFDGQDLNTLSDKELRKARQEMGMIFQQFNLLMQRTALENVCFPLELAGVKKDEAVKRAQELLEIVGLSERANAYPVQLSGGQKQRVAIARALATNPKVLLCDEATSALDPQTTASILALLKKLSKEMGITVIIITHEMSVIEEVCSRVAIIANHRIAEVGSVQEIFTHPKTDATRQLVYREEEDPVTYRPGEGRFLRVVYNGSHALEPIIAKMILDLNLPVNIIHANLRSIEGDTYGDMVIQLPDLVESERAMRYLLDRGISVEGVTQDA